MVSLCDDVLNLPDEVKEFYSFLGLPILLGYSTSPLCLFPSLLLTSTTPVSPVRTRPLRPESQNLCLCQTTEVDLYLESSTPVLYLSSVP